MSDLSQPREGDETSPKSSRKLLGPIAWMARNSVASNLMMLVAVLGGLLAAIRV